MSLGAIDDTGRQDTSMTDTKARPSILLVDDEKPILDALYRFCRQRKFDATRANSGAEALEIMAETTFDVIVSDMRMPNMDGAEFLKQARDKMPKATRILLTGYADMEAVISAVNEAKIYNYLNKPWDDNMLESVIRSALDFKYKEDERLSLLDEVANKNKELSHLNESLEAKVIARTQALEEAMRSVQLTNKKVSKNFRESLGLLTNIIEMQDGSKFNYTQMIADASVAIAKALELSAKEIEQIRIASLLHNVGKLSLPDSIRKKHMNTLTKMEKEVFHQHPIQGEAVLSGMTGLKTVARIVRSHTEYINGKGFPDRLIINAIPVGSRIISVTSDFQKLESNLQVDEISTPEAAMGYLKENAGKLYDARIVELFAQYYEENLQDYRSPLSQIPLEKIQEGMILGENLVSASGLLLLTKDTPINQEHMEQLKSYEDDVGTGLIFPIATSSIDALIQAQEQIAEQPGAQH